VQAINKTKRDIEQQIELCIKQRGHIAWNINSIYNDLVDKSRKFLSEYTKVADQQILDFANDLARSLQRSRLMYNDYKKYLSYFYSEEKQNVNDIPLLMQYVLYELLYESILAYKRTNPERNEAMIVAEKLEYLRLPFRKINDLHRDLGLDVIRDFRLDYQPYRKVVQYYQGMKTPALCFMLNILIQQLPEDVDTYIDGCGGTGTTLYNKLSYIDYDVEMERNELGYLMPAISKEIYNDWGYLNYIFYKFIKESPELIIKKIREFIEDVELHDSTKKTNYLDVEKKSELKDIKTETYMEVGKFVRGKSYNSLLKKIKELENKENGYISKDEEIVANLKSNLEKFVESNEKITGTEKYNVIALESYLLGRWTEYEVIWHRIQHEDVKKVLDIEKEEDINEFAHIFFIYGFFSNRKVANDCFENRFIELKNTYVQLINNAHDRFINVVISNNDICEMIIDKKEFNSERTIVYADIPYSGTDDNQYVTRPLNANFVKRFVNSLKSYKGKYIISERYNIASTHPIYGELELRNRLNSKKYELDKQTAKKLDGCICDKKEFYNDLQNIKPKYVWFYIPTNSFSVDDGNEFNLNEAWFLNFLKNNTYFGNPIEIMITNIELQGFGKNTTNLLEKVNVGNAKVQFLPCMNNIVLAVMSYNNFLETVNLNYNKGFGNRVFEEEEARDIAAAMYEYYQRDLNI